jgi:hypothetical protein
MKLVPLNEDQTSAWTVNISDYFFFCKSIPTAATDYEIRNLNCQGAFSTVPSFEVIFGL